MEKILKQALSKAIPTTDALIEVINATPNPTVAAEIILGIYKKPEIFAAGTEFRKIYHDPLFISYDKFLDEVHFKYTPVEIIYGWVLKDIAKPKLDDIISTKEKLEDALYEINTSKNNVQAYSLASFTAKFNYVATFSRKKNEEARAKVKLSDWKK